MSSNSARRRLGRAAFGAFILAAALGMSSGPAFAHNYPVGYSPDEGAVVTEQPGVFTVTTNEDLLDLDGAGASSAMQVRGPAGSVEPLYYGDGCVMIFGPTVETEAQLGEPGEYTVIWQAVSTDGHPVSGEYTFTWQPVEGQALATGAKTAPNCGGSAPAGPVTTDAAVPGENAAGGAAIMDVAWIAGALGAVVLAVIVTLLLARRNHPAGSADPESPESPESPEKFPSP